MASGSAKEFVLKQNDTPLLRQVLEYAYNPFFVYGVKQYNKIQTLLLHPVSGAADQALTIFFVTLDALKKKELTGNIAKQRLDNALDEVGSHSLELRSICERIVDRDLDIGVGVTTINKVFPGLIPTFECGLAKDVDWKKCRWPMLAEVKYDGKRIIAVVQNGTATLYSRNGRVETKYQHIRDELESWAEVDCVLDGELMWGMFGDRSENEADVQFVVFDMLSIEEWTTKRCKRTMKERRRYLEVIMSELTDHPHVVASEGRIVEDITEATEFYDNVVSNGGEGIMLKLLDRAYEFKRGWHWMKFKPVNDVDLPVVSVFEGEGKYEGMLGGFIVRHKGVEVRVGSGFSDEQRAKFWGETMGNHMVGSMIEVRYTEVTPDGSLRFPRFVRIRDDK